MPEERKVRADAQRNVNSLLAAARDVFATAGVDAPVREIAAKAGVGVGTVYRHFPLRSDLVTAVMKSEIDACADAAAELAAELPPLDALRAWLLRYTGFIATKTGLAAALHSGDPAFEPLPAYFRARYLPALESLLDAAAGEIRRDIDAYDLLTAVANLSIPAEGDPEHTQRMVALLVDGLRFGAPSSLPR